MDPSLVEIVITDDDEALRELLAEGLQTLGARITLCRDGQDLKEHLTSAHANGTLPGLVISDQRMPRVTGLEVLAWMKRSGIEVPFVLMSAFAADQLREGGVRHGATRVFDKPVDLKELRAFVAELLAARASGSSPPDASEESAPEQIA